MVAPYIAIAGTIPTIQAATLLKSNIKNAKKKKPKIVKQAVKNIVGIDLIRIQSGLVAGL